MYPIDDILPNILTHFRTFENLTLQAPPGAGKTTIVPLGFLDEDWFQSGKIIMLEPRRIAARAAAARLSQLNKTSLGEEIGYRVKMDHRAGKDTRIEVVTEGVLIRMIQNDPELRGVKMVIFDEFHERSLDADFGLALTLDLQEALRPDLKILVMSATLDGQRVAELINSKILTSEGRSYPVTYHYAERNIPLKSFREMEVQITQVIRGALADSEGSILVFLPGAGEIERVKQALLALKLGEDILIAPLYGMMKGAAQDLAIRPAPKGKRKITLSTAIAQTSLTIEGINMVVDSGLIRTPIYDTASGMTKLETRRVSKATATQRAGRAGRLSDGICYRLWTRGSHAGLAPFDAIEIKGADLLPLVLELAQWGTSSPEDLKWLDLPDPANFAQAAELLQELEALDAEKRITSHGKKMAKMPLHPRLSHMILKAAEIGQMSLALKIAALLGEKDIIHLGGREKNSDMRLRIEALNAAADRDQGRMRELRCDAARAKRVLAQVRNWQRSFKDPSGQEFENTQMAGVVLAFAYPDRIAQNRAQKGNGGGEFLLSGGKGAVMETSDVLSSEKFLTAATLFVRGVNAKIFLAAPISLEEIEEYFSRDLKWQETTQWDKRKSAVMAQRQLKFGRLTLKIQKLIKADEEQEIRAMIEGIRQMGLSCLPWKKQSAGKTITQKALRIRERAAFVHECSFVTSEMCGLIPDMREQALLETLEEWLAPYLYGMKSKADLQALNMSEIIQNMLGYQAAQLLDEWLPSHITVPSGSNIAIDYDVSPPVLAVRMQELFGLGDTPSIMGGRLKLLLHLLSPAKRPLQVTQDLKHFWQNSYEPIKKEMRGRYPKHYWPDNPLEAEPTSRIKKKM
jgi:ATP-dependent helicase HrpB